MQTESIKIKKHYKNKYTTIDNIIINDMSLSFQSKGLFLYLWSKPDDWSVNVKQIQHHCIDKQTKIYSSLTELENMGYLIRKRYYVNGKVAGINYNLSDTKEYDNDLFNEAKLNQGNLNEENQDEYIYIPKKEDNKIKTIGNKNIKKETIPSEKETLFENFYKLYNNKTEITEQTKQTKGYNTLKEKFLKEVKTAKEEDILQGTRDYLSFIAFEHKRGFNRPLKDIQTFINQSAWEGDKGIPWSEVVQNNLNTHKPTQTQNKQNTQSKVDYDFDTKKDFEALFNN